MLAGLVELIYPLFLQHPESKSKNHFKYFLLIPVYNFTLESVKSFNT